MEIQDGYADRNTPQPAQRPVALRGKPGDLPPRTSQQAVTHKPPCSSAMDLTAATAQSALRLRADGGEIDDDFTIAAANIRRGREPISTPQPSPAILQRRGKNTRQRTAGYPARHGDGTRGLAVTCRRGYLPQSICRGL